MGHGNWWEISTSDNSNFLSHHEINDKYNVGCNFLNILQLRQSIPFSWREAIHGIDVKNIYINRNKITVTNQNGNVLGRFQFERHGGGAEGKAFENVLVRG